MGTAYKIKCKHCGTEFQHSASACYGLYQEFNEQVEVVMMWD